MVMTNENKDEIVSDSYVNSTMLNETNIVVNETVSNILNVDYQKTDAVNVTVSSESANIISSNSSNISIFSGAYDYASCKASQVYYNPILSVFSAGGFVAGVYLVCYMFNAFKKDSFFSKKDKDGKVKYIEDVEKDKNEKNKSKLNRFNPYTIGSRLNRSLNPWSKANEVEKKNKITKEEILAEKEVLIESKEEKLYREKEEFKALESKVLDVDNRLLNTLSGSLGIIVQEKIEKKESMIELLYQSDMNHMLALIQQIENLANIEEVILKVVQKTKDSKNNIAKEAEAKEAKDIEVTQV